MLSYRWLINFLKARPIDWGGILRWEQTGVGLPVFANGGALVLFGCDVDVFRLAACGLADVDIAMQISLSERHVARLRRAFARYLGATSTKELERIASSYPQLQPR